MGIGWVGFFPSNFSVLQELLVSAGTLEFSSGKAEIAEVSKCFGDVSSCYYRFRYLIVDNLITYIWLCCAGLCILVILFVCYCL